MGADHHMPNIHVKYQWHETAGSAAEEQLHAFAIHDAAVPGPADMLWTARPDRPNEH